MAKGNPWYGTVSGKLGESVFAQVKGKQTIRGYTAHPKDAHTRAQAEHRTQLSNLNAGYRLMKPLLESSFESKPGDWSDANAFISKNLNVEKVYLEKQFARENSFVVARYHVSHGTLPAISVSETSENVFMTSILYPAGFVPSESTTVKEFTSAVLSANMDWKANDQLTCAFLEQRVDAETGGPLASMKLYEVTLDGTDESLLYSVFPEMFCVNTGGRLGAQGDIPAGGAVYMHSRKELNDKLRVSSQRLFLTGADDIYRRFTGGGAATRASDSYGARSEAFLVPKAGSGSTPTTPTAAQITGVSIGGVSVLSTSVAVERSSGTNVVISGRGLDAATIEVKINGGSMTVPVDTWLSDVVQTGASVTGTTRSSGWLSGLYLTGVLIRAWASPEIEDPTA